MLRRPVRPVRHPDPAPPPVRKLRPDEIARPTLEELAALPRHPIIVVLDNVRSAHNVGSVFRTADAARVARVVCCGFTPTPSDFSIAKTALGAEQTVPWQHAEDAAEALEALRADGYTLAALEQTDRPTRIEEVGPEHFPLALVLGNEVDGVQQRALDRCDLAVELPQFGAKHSLNVAVAFGVAVYELLERWRSGG